MYTLYKIPYRRARAWPSLCSAFRPSASRRASKGILHTKLDSFYFDPSTWIPPLGSFHSEPYIIFGSFRSYHSSRILPLGYPLLGSLCLVPTDRIHSIECLCLASFAWSLPLGSLRLDLSIQVLSLISLLSDPSAQIPMLDSRCSVSSTRIHPFMSLLSDISNSTRNLLLGSFRLELLTLMQTLYFFFIFCL